MGDSKPTAPDGRTRHPDTILSVDDNEANRYTRSRALRAEGFEVIEAVNGAEALRLAGEKQPSLVLLDIQLPDFNGFDVCQRLKSNPQTTLIPVLQISSVGKPEHDYPEALASGAEAYLREPVEPATLVAVIAALIRAAAAEARARRTEKDAVDILESVGEAMCLLDQDYRFEYINAEAARLLGMDREYLIGKTRAEVFPQAVGNLAELELRRVMAERTPSSFENFYEPWQKWYEVKANPVSAGGIAVSFRDITERKQAEEERQRLVADLRERTAALESTTLFPEENPMPVLRVREDGALLYANPASGLLLTDWGCGIGDAVPERIRQAVTAAIAHGFPSEHDIRADGRDYSFVVAPIGRRGYANLYGRDMTGRKQAQQALRESEERFRALVTASSEALYRMSPDWREMRQLRGGDFLADTEAPSRNWLQEYIHPDDQPRVTAIINEAIRTKSIFEMEHRIRRADGSLGWTFSRAIPVEDANGQIVEWFGAASDITQRKQAEEALRESEANYRQLFDSMQEVFFVAEVATDESGAAIDYRFLEANPALERITGLKRHELIGRLATEATPGLDRHWIEILGKVALTGEPTQFEQYATPLDRWYEVRAYSPQPGRFAATFLDTTDRKRAEEALANAIQRLNAHMDNSPLAIVEFDPQFRVTRWSKEAERVFGWCADEILGRAVAEMRWVYEDDVEAVRQVSQDMIEGRRPRNVSVNRNYSKNGSIIECEWYNSAIYDGSGKLTSILSQVLDITEKKRTEERLRQTQKLESVGLLAGGIAHDFNNLLTGIMGNASTVLDEVDPDSAERIREVISSAERAANLTRQLLAYSGKGRFVTRDVDVSEALHGITGMVEFSVPKSVELAVNVQRRLPTVRMDPSQLEQILMNLVINAGEAIGEGNPGKITVATSMADIERPFVDAIGEEVTPGRYVSIAVSDTGSGIDEQNKAKIFDPFFTTKFTGRGLGLAAVAGILRSYQGAITLDTAPGRGSTFQIFLPAAEKHVRTSAEQATADERATILVVDDEATVRDFIGAALRRQKYCVLSASDGREALAVCEREGGSIDAAILDVVMPLMGANDLMPALKSRRPDMRILLTSGYSESEARRLCAAYPGAAFIQKPYTAQQIARAVDELLFRYR